jgi:hypothetical protein
VGSGGQGVRATRLYRIVLPVLACFLAGIAPAQEEFHHPELEWRTIETTHFFVHYHTGTDRTARTVAKIAEEIYGPITSLYDHEPDGKVSFVIKDYDDYSNGAAYFFDNKVEIWASSLDSDLRGSHNWLRNVITHEFTHIIQIQTSFKFGRRVPAIYLQWLGYESERRQDVLYGYPNRIVSYPLSGFVIPSWFAEGVAQYNRKELDYDYWDSHRDMILRSYVLDGNMLSWNEMSVFGKTSLGNESSYNAGFSFVSYLVDRFGDGKLEEISRNLSTLTEVTIDGAIARATGEDGEKVYRDWQEALKADYTERTAAVRAAQAGGEIIGNVGFANLYPAFSPDGNYLAYISNKGGDYFSSSSLYLYDLAAKTERRVSAGVRSNFSWSPDGKTIYFSKNTRDNPFWSSYYDIFSVDVESGDEKRITEGLRSNAPAVSPDGRRIAFVSGSDGTLNLFTMGTDGTGIMQLTRYDSGQQVYNPAWSPDGKTIIFDFSIKDGRDILEVPSAGGEVQPLVATADDERTGTFADSGRTLYYSSDRTGIFNVYRLDLATGRTDQITNVVGGAFMPEVGAGGKLAFATYTSSGYKLALMSDPKPLDAPAGYVRKGGPSDVHAAFPGLPSVAAAGSPAAGTNGTAAGKGGPFDWPRLRNYDDTKLPPVTDGKYNNATTTLTVIPFLRFDNYNPRNTGLEVLKPGAYLFSYDMLDRYGFFASAAANLKGDRDLFFTFDYNGPIPGLINLGMDPGLSLEVYNVTRSTGSFIPLPLDTIPVDIDYNLIEFDAAFHQKLFTEALGVEYGYRHSRYTADIGTFFLPEARFLVPATGILYFKGNDLFFDMKLDATVPSRTQEINPTGRKIRLRYDYEFNDFDPTDQIDSRGELAHVFKNVNFHRLEGSIRESHTLPGWSHTLSTMIRGGTIFGPPVDDFFDFYLGGLNGMKGYPYYSLGGNEYAHANVTYRFPLLENIDMRFLQFYFDKLYAAVYGDAGTAWSGGPLKGQRFIRDAGFELRLESFSFYAYPTRVFFNATYGFDTFSRYVASRDQVVPYGGEWQFHFGVLFGFDFD